LQAVVGSHSAMPRAEAGARHADEVGLVQRAHINDWAGNSTPVCSIGADEICPGSPGGVHCSGNSCCPSTAELGTFACPSADPDWQGCDRPKRWDCTEGCSVGASVQCPGSDASVRCAGNQCCPSVNGSGTFVCPSADGTWSGAACENPKKLHDCVGPGVGPAGPSSKVHYPHFDTTPDYLGIGAKARGVEGGTEGSASDNFYLVLGDWGGCGHGCCCGMQEQVARKMHEYVAARKRRNPRSTLLFVLSVGDNFYWHGCQENSFNETWLRVYSKELLDVPWFSVLGNHDYGNDDHTIGCPYIRPRFVCNESNANTPACGGAKPYSTEPQGYNSNQFNTDKGGLGGASRANYHMPDYTYYYTIPALNFELIAMDWNWLGAFPGALGGDGVEAGQGAHKLVEHCGSTAELSRSMRGIQDASAKLLKARATAAEHGNVAIIGHYPEIFMGGYHGGANFRRMYLESAPKNRTADMKIFNFYGHTHVQECQAKDPSGACVDFLTGGSGGCCNATTDVPAGFVAVSWNAQLAQFTECFLDPECTLDTYEVDQNVSSDPGADGGGCSRTILP